MTKCTICGDEIKSTDREAIHFEICCLNTDSANNGNICGDCMQSAEAKFFKLWRVAK